MNKRHLITLAAILSSTSIYAAEKCQISTQLKASPSSQYRRMLTISRTCDDSNLDYIFTAEIGTSSIIANIRNSKMAKIEAFNMARQLYLGGFRISEIKKSNFGFNMTLQKDSNLAMNIDFCYHKAYKSYGEPTLSAGLSVGVICTDSNDTTFKLLDRKEHRAGDLDKSIDRSSPEYGYIVIVTDIKEVNEELRHDLNEKGYSTLSPESEMTNSIFLRLNN